jgi:hypothetical protein
VAVAEEIVRVALARGVGDNLYGCGRGGNSCAVAGEVFRVAVAGR